MKSIKVYIGTHREVGQKCKDWAADNMPSGFELVDDFDSCEIFISVLYDRLISETQIRSKKKCFNIHPGILPQHRGSGSYSWVILNGERYAGVTLHEIDQSIDHGPIIEVRDFLVGKKSTAESLFHEAEKIIYQIFQDWFHKLLIGNYTTEQQDESKARLYYRKQLDQAKDLTRFVRAFHFDGKEQAYYFNAIDEKIYLKWK